ncbi:hypothetical protein [Desulforamulus reducens]|uniref:hypothetical protein n=1 Tax=Desulforamulus reducens TaxID=59610 RepID=UPI0018DDE0F5|nr:hypothetical protein [Desulforamulus reducens]
MLQTWMGKGIKLPFEGANSRSVHDYLAEGQPTFKINVKLQGTIIEAVKPI